MNACVNFSVYVHIHTHICIKINNHLYKIFICNILRALYIYIYIYIYIYLLTCIWFIILILSLILLYAWVHVCVEWICIILSCHNLINISVILSRYSDIFSWFHALFQRNFLIKKLRCIFILLCVCVCVCVCVRPNLRHEQDTTRDQIFLNGVEMTRLVDFASLILEALPRLRTHSALLFRDQMDPCLFPWTLVRRETQTPLSTIRTQALVPFSTAITTCVFRYTGKTVHSFMLLSRKDYEDPY